MIGDGAMPAIPFTRQRPECSFRAEHFGDPIEFFYGEHERIRRTCEWLHRLAGDRKAPEARETATSVLAFLEFDLPLHLADEEEDLFPLLRRRSPGSDPRVHDEVVSCLEVLEQEHRDDIEQGRTLLPALRNIAAGLEPADPAMFVHYVRAFISLQRGHQARENRIILPAALKRFSTDDLSELGRNMAARRGLSEPD